MNRDDIPGAATCYLCGEAFKLPEDDVDGNLPRMLLCGHVYCTVCLQSIQCDGVIRCPECEVESTLPERGVYGLQEDSRITGLIYTAKMNKMKRSKNRRKNKVSTPADSNENPEDKEQPADNETIAKVVDEALDRAAENRVQLDNIHETLTTGLAGQVKRERVRVEMEIRQAADKALHAVQKWRDVQLTKLTELEAQFPTSQAAVYHVQETIKALETAMQMAREVRRVPFLKQYCVLDKVLETLQAPVDNQSFNMECITMGSGLSCIFQSEALNQNLALSLKMETGDPKPLSQTSSKGLQPGGSIRKSPRKHAVHGNSSCVPPSHNKPPTPQKKQNQSSSSSPSQGCTPSPIPRRRVILPHHSSALDLGSPDVIIEELFHEEQERAPVPTGPELASDKCRIHKRRQKQLSLKKRNVTPWVVVTHIVNPNHFYVCYMAEKRESETLSQKINLLCGGDGCGFTLSDTVETGAMIFVKWKEGLWWRASVVEVLQNGCVEAVKACPVTQLASVQVFFLDFGLTLTVTIQSEEGATESSLKAVNNHLRKVHETVSLELGHFAPQAIRCSLKDLVPYDVTKGWSKEAVVKFRCVIGSAAVEMKPLGQNTDSLLVDLKKAPMDQSSDVSFSVREYLVFIEVARFYSPVTSGRSPLLYYPPVYPKINIELSAVVSHINNPGDFYIQLVDNMESLLLSAKLQEYYNATTEFGKEKLQVYCPVIGQACVARYEDSLWYRAQVIGHSRGRKVEVLYVDFGNKKTLSVSDLREIKDEFFALPSMAINCCLSDTIPVDGETWSEACTNRFFSLAHQKLVTVVATGTVPKTEPLPVKLFESSLNGQQTDIAELLVQEELACSNKGQKPKNASSPDDGGSAIWDPPLGLTTEKVDAADQLTSGEQKEEPLEFQPQLQLPACLKGLKVIVSHVNSPSSFYVQFSQNDSLLKRASELVKQECALMEFQDVEWKADMYCALHINDVWERGQICSDVTSNNIAEVRRCDHGNTLKLHVSNLRPLPSSLMGSLALECTLNDIRPAGGRSTWSDTARDIISYYLTGTSAVMTIEESTDERPVPVTLLCTNRMAQFMSIADFLVNKGLALKKRKPQDAVVQQPKETDAQAPVTETQTDDGEKIAVPPDSLIPFRLPSHIISTPSTPTPPKPAPRSIMSAEKVKTPLYQPPELPYLGHIQIRVSAVGEDGLIYTRTQNAECQLEQLQEKIQQSMKTLPRQKSYTWKSVLGCAVVGPDMLWYRGQLLEVLGGHVTVQYVDYGLVENIPVVHLYPILLCDDVPQLCMPCQLFGINPVGGKWQQDAVALLREMLVNRCVGMQIVELPASPRGPLKVELFLDGLSLSRILCHHDHASMVRPVLAQKGLSVMSPAHLLDDWDISTEGLRDPEEPMFVPFVNPDLPQEGEHFKVRVKHLCTPNELFLWPLEGTADVKVDGETLDEALTRINANINSLPRLTSFPHGGPCLAEYNDGNYYRAKLMNFISLEPLMILVQHVDFGSDDTLTTSKLRQMPAELLQFPTKALKVKVGGLKVPSVNREEAVLPYSPGWSVKAALMMIDLLHGDITASVVAREPELTVLLYNKDKELVHLPLVSSRLAEVE